MKNWQEEVDQNYVEWPMSVKAMEMGWELEASKAIQGQKESRKRYLAEPAALINREKPKPLWVCARKKEDGRRRGFRQNYGIVGLVLGWVSVGAHHTHPWRWWTCSQREAWGEPEQNARCQGPVSLDPEQTSWARAAGAGAAVAASLRFAASSSSLLLPPLLLTHKKGSCGPSP
jgi:hypothetical protein